MKTTVADTKRAAKKDSLKNILIQYSLQQITFKSMSPDEILLAALELEITF